MCEVKLHGDQTFDLRQQKYKVSEKLKTGEASALFGMFFFYLVHPARAISEHPRVLDYLSDSVDAFLTDSTTQPTPAGLPSGIPPSLSSPALSSPSSVDTDPPALHLGLTFSFPVEQKALDSGVLLTWTKGFAAKNAIGNDVVKLLQDAFDRKHMHVKCVALVNDVGLGVLFVCLAQLIILCMIDCWRVAVAIIYSWGVYARFAISTLDTI